HVLPDARPTWLDRNHERRSRADLSRQAPDLHGVPGLSVAEGFALEPLTIEHAARTPAASTPTDAIVRVPARSAGRWDGAAAPGASSGRAESTGQSERDGTLSRRREDFDCDAQIRGGLHVGLMNAMHHGGLMLFSS